MAHTSPHSRDKHWEFYVYWTSISPVIAPVIERFFPDGTTATALPGTSASWIDRDRTLNEQRARILAAYLQDQISCGSIDFHHDPEEGEAPSIVRDDVAARLLLYLDGTYESRGLRADDEPGALALFDADAHGFGPVADHAPFIEALTDALVEAVDAGRVEVDASEPWDSCSGCGGYQNVNYDCSADTD